MDNKTSIQKSNAILQCLIADDETLAREGIISYASKLTFLKVVSVCSSASEILESLKKNKIDLMFLDIQMPDLTGLELLESLDKPPLTILTTAYAEYALEGYKFQVVDYLLKPITFNRFLQSALRAQELYHLKHTNDEADASMYIRQGETFLKINWVDILYIESMENYLKLHFKEKYLIIHQTMAFIENTLPGDAFFRIHKSYLVHLSYIEIIKGNFVYINDMAIPISRQKKQAFMETVVYKNLISK